MAISAQTAVGTIATEHPLATRVFARHGIDFCCGGGKPLAEVCTTQGLVLDRILAEIEHEVAARPAAETRWDREPLPALITHILERFHTPLKEELPRLATMAQKVQRVHGQEHPELAKILEVFLALQQDLEQHMMKEEQVLFPMIAKGQGRMACGPVSVMEEEHEAAGEMLLRLRALTNGFEVPAAACNTWRALWAGLSSLEHDLHEHIHLENNILHKRALAS